MTPLSPSVPALRGCSLEELRKEPWRLQIQAENAAEQLRNLVLKNYHLFIQSNQCSAIVKDDLLQLKDEADAVVAFIPELKAYCARFQAEVASVVARHGDIQFVFEHYLQLTELLDIPQLLEACIHNDMFDAALDVIQFAHETFQTERDEHAAPNFVITALVREVAQMTRVMREKLLQKLREDLQLALCVRVVSYLRRLDALAAAQHPSTSSTSMAPVAGTLEYERQLKDEFLSCRSVWLASLSRAVSAADPYQYTIQLIDIKRTSWFDMLTQYSAIFGNETVDGKVDPPLCRWATTTVADFIQILTKQLPKIDDFSSLATILEQSLFFGGSLGRVGVDFRAILVVYFEDHVLALMEQQWRAASREFHDALYAHSLVVSSSSSPSSSFTKTPIVIASHRTAASASTSNGLAVRSALTTPTVTGVGSGGSEDYTPPHALMAFPILAEFTNAVLVSLNELRLCTIASLQTRLAKALRDTICALVLALASFCDDNNLHLVIARSGASVDAASAPTHSDASGKPLQANSTPSSKRNVLAEALQSTVEILRRELIPYLVKCFQRLYPNVSPSAALLDPAQFEQLMHERALLRRPVPPAEETPAVVSGLSGSM